MATQLARLQVSDHGNLAAEQLLRAIELRDAGENLPRLLFPDINRQEEKFVCFGDALGGEHFADAQVDFGKVSDVDETRNPNGAGISFSSMLTRAGCALLDYC